MKLTEMLSANSLGYESQSMPDSDVTFIRLTDKWWSESSRLLFRADAEVEQLAVVLDQDGTISSRDLFFCGIARPDMANGSYAAFQVAGTREIIQLYGLKYRTMAVGKVFFAHEIAKDHMIVLCAEHGMQFSAESGIPNYNPNCRECRTRLDLSRKVSA